MAAFAASEDVVEHDNSRIAIFLQPAISFLSFEEREYFQDAIDTIYSEFRSVARNEEESLYVAKQNFQKVNFCFPIFGGLQFQVRQDHFVSAGLGFIYDNESVVLTDRKNKSHNYSYTIQGIPLFLEYRLAIPVNLMTLSDGGLFSIALRWYWTLPGTEIYSSWGKIDADNSPFGAGFGLSVGYLIASWKGLNIFGDIGFSTIKVKSKETFADIVPGGPTEKAKWDIGGLQLQIRVSFGVWNKPKPIEKDEDDDIPDTDEASSDTPKAAAQDSSKAQVQDSSKTQAQAAQDSTQQAPAAQDSAQVTPQDSTVQDSAQASGVKKSDEKPAQAPAVKDSAKVEPAKAEKPAAKKPDEKPAQAPAKKEPVSAKTPEE
ncbi:MAG: hypothetical protein IKX42_04980 [Fibrobacter sp.]|nr:hypothetical protein [Fibrobacter sp.]